MGGSRVDLRLLGGLEMKSVANFAPGGGGKWVGWSPEKVVVSCSRSVDRPGKALQAQGGTCVVSPSPWDCLERQSVKVWPSCNRRFPETSGLEIAWKWQILGGVKCFL